MKVIKQIMSEVDIKYSCSADRVVHNKYHCILEENDKFALVGSPDLKLTENGKLLLTAFTPYIFFKPMHYESFNGNIDNYFSRCYSEYGDGYDDVYMKTIEIGFKISKVEYTYLIPNSWNDWRTEKCLGYILSDSDFRWKLVEESANTTAKVEKQGILSGLLWGASGSRNVSTSTSKTYTIAIKLNICSEAFTIKLNQKEYSLFSTAYF